MKISKWPALFLLTLTPVCALDSSDTDRRIVDAARESYNFRTVLEDKVNVKAHDGVVTLTGRVPDRDEKSLAEQTVADLPGVVMVLNQIEIVPPGPDRSDPWIAMEIRAVLLVKAHVSATDTTVDVANGVVTLGGKAENDAQKDLTELYARSVEGVKSVRNEIVVPDTPSNHETVGEDIDDVSITGQLKYALLSHRSTSALKTKVVTENGLVVVTGEAESAAEKALVTQLAESIRGVKSVENLMSVRN